VLAAAVMAAPKATRAKAERFMCPPRLPAGTQTVQQGS
jgi:hypothetical protein